MIVTKTFRLLPNTNGVEVDLKFESPDKERSVVYNLLGPHGIPIEGEWYTGTFRDVVFGQLNGQKVEIVTHAASDVVSATDSPIDNTKLPAGFCRRREPVFRHPWSSPSRHRPAIKIAGTARQSPWCCTRTKRPRRNPTWASGSAPGRSRSVPNHPVTHNYRVFAGPKTNDALAPYHAEGLAKYRKNQWIPLAPEIARFVITPTLGFTYEVTKRVGRLIRGVRTGTTASRSSC